MLVTASGMVTLFKFVSYTNEKPLISLSDSGRTRLSRPLQYEKAYSPIEVIVEAKLTLLK